MEQQGTEGEGMRGNRCTCCGAWTGIRYPYKRAKLCARCLNIFVIDALLRHIPVVGRRVLLRAYKRRERKRWG